jgi:hypothetical protein
MNSRSIPRTLAILGSLSFALLFTGCATKITPTLIKNPPPAEKLSAFTRFELHPINLLAPYAGQEANERALKKIQENFSLRAEPLIRTWNETAASSAPQRTLIIKPVISEIKFIGGGARFWAGALAGSSAVIARIELIDQETGTRIAHPEFYARAAAMAGAWTFGSTDNIMLIRIANRMADYLSSNYVAAVGSPTGADTTD